MFGFWASFVNWYAACSQSGGGCAISVIMKENRMKLKWWTIGVLFSVGAASADETKISLSELREEFEVVDAAYRDTPKPKFGDPDFQADLTVWSDLNSQRREALGPYVSALYREWDVRKDEPGKRRQIESKLLALRQEETRKPTEYGMRQQRAFASQARSRLVKATVTREEAVFLTKLCVPGAHQRHTDNLARNGRPTEPFGWDVQDTYSLGLMRSGEYDKARVENELVLLKTSLLFRGREKYERQFFLQRALLEAYAGKLDVAKEYAAKTLEPLEGESDSLNGAELRAELKSLLTR